MDIGCICLELGGGGADGMPESFPAGVTHAGDLLRPTAAQCCRRLNCRLCNRLNRNLWVYIVFCCLACGNDCFFEQKEDADEADDEQTAK